MLNPASASLLFVQDGQGFAPISKARPYAYNPDLDPAEVGERTALLQRFDALGPVERKELLDHALGLVQRMRDAKLPPRERAIKRLIDRIDRCIGLLADTAETDAIKLAMYKMMIREDTAELASFGVSYFGTPS